ncbi:DUF2637 domain-containing protein [Isoptericola sp. NPDC056605]|uniref:DUF2637 domain-containing protein n=1 Tax=Isoptericola sp. NPDC056605 TaxID=3345876 RepID=UPI0036AAE097
MHGEQAGRLAPTTAVRPDRWLGLDPGHFYGPVRAAPSQNGHPPHLPPGDQPITTEQGVLVSRKADRPRKPRRIVEASGTAVVALTAAVISFGHVQKVARDAGESELAAILLPLSIDGAIASAAAVILADSKAGRKAPKLAWLMLILSLAASLAANVAAAEPTVLARAVAIWPPIALALGVEVFASISRRARETETPETNVSGPARSVPAPALPARPAPQPAYVARTDGLAQTAPTSASEGRASAMGVEPGQTDQAVSGSDDDRPARQPTREQTSVARAFERSADQTADHPADHPADRTATRTTDRAERGPAGREPGPAVAIGPVPADQSGPGHQVTEADHRTNQAATTEQVTGHTASTTSRPGPQAVGRTGPTAVDHPAHDTTRVGPRPASASTSDAQAITTIRELDAEAGRPVSRRTVQATLDCGASRANRLMIAARADQDADLDTPDRQATERAA